jgi:hypothetical protein
MRHDNEPTHKNRESIEVAELAEGVGFVGIESWK